MQQVSTSVKHALASQSDVLIHYSDNVLHSQKVEAIFNNKILCVQ